MIHIFTIQILSSALIILDCKMRVKPFSCIVCTRLWVVIFFRYLIISFIVAHILYICIVISYHDTLINGSHSFWCYRYGSTDMNNEEEVQRVFRGDLDTAKWAIPRLVKVFIASTRNGTSYILFIFKTKIFVT